MGRQGARRGAGVPVLRRALTQLLRWKALELLGAHRGSLVYKNVWLEFAGKLSRATGSCVWPWDEPHPDKAEEKISYVGPHSSLITFRVF